MRLRDRRRNWKEALVDWSLPILTALLAVVLPVVFESIPEQYRHFAGLISHPIGYVFLVIVLAEIVLVIFQVAAAERRRSQQRAGVSQLGDALGDTFTALKKLINSESGEPDKERFFQAIVAEVKSLMPLDRPRTCVYELDGSDADEDGVPREYLRLVTWGGRVDQPRAEFRGDTDHGAALVNIAKGSQWRCVDNIRKPSFKIDTNSETVWRSFMAIPFQGGRKGRGVLTIDTPTRTYFTEDHRTIGLAIARLMEIGLARVAGAADDTHTEVSEVMATLARLSHTRTEGEGEK